MTVYTRSINDELYGKMREFIPVEIECRKMTGYNHWEDALRFVQDVIKDCPGFAVILDEDCFIHDWGKIQGLVAHMMSHGYTHAGIPDRGVIPHRTSQWTTMNPFFNVLNCHSLKMQSVFDRPLGKPDFIAAPEFEPFDDFYRHLWKIGKPLFLRAATRADGITTHMMDHEGNFFGLHAWYSREYNNAGPHRDRINQVYQDAKSYL